MQGRNRAHSQSAMGEGDDAFRSLSSARRRQHYMFRATGISEIVVDQREGTFRTVYTIEFKDDCCTACISKEEQSRDCYSEKRDRLDISKAETSSTRVS